MNLLKLISHISVKFAWVSVCLLGFLLVCFLFTKILSLRKIKKDSHLEGKIFFLSKKLYKSIVIFITTTLLFHGFYMTFYIAYLKHENLVLFGYIVLTIILFTAFSGTLYYISETKTKMEKFIHAFLMISIIFFICLHISEHKWGSIKKEKSLPTKHILSVEKTNS